MVVRLDRLTRDVWFLHQVQDGVGSAGAQWSLGEWTQARGVGGVAVRQRERVGLSMPNFLSAPSTDQGCPAATLLLLPP